MINRYFRLLPARTQRLDINGRVEITPFSNDGSLLYCWASGANHDCTDHLLSATALILLIPETFPLNVKGNFRRRLNVEVVKLACLITDRLSVVRTRRKYMRF